MNYDFFLFTKLYDVYINIDYYYDEMFEDLGKLYKKFLESDHNNINGNPYDNIESFFRANISQIKMITSHKIKNEL